MVKFLAGVIIFGCMTPKGVGLLYFIENDFYAAIYEEKIEKT